MNGELRIIQIMLVSFAKDNLVLEDELERTINCDEPITIKEIEIKRLLKEIILNDEMIKKWAEYTTENIKEEIKEEES